MKKNKTIKNYKGYVIGILLGLAVGCMTLIGQKYLPINLNFLANSASMWLIPSFLSTYYMQLDKKSSIILCIACLLSCVYGYYIFEAIYNQHSFIFSRYITIWSACALIGGTVFGLGAYWANTKTNWLKYFGQNLLPATFLAEGLIKLIHIQDYMHMVVAIFLMIVIGFILYFIINFKSAFIKQNLLSLLVLVTLGLCGNQMLYWVTT